MRIYNKSSVSTAKIRPLLDFIEKSTRYHKLCVLRLQDLDHKGIMTEGEARLSTTPRAWRAGRPSRIRLDLSRGRKYPDQTQYIKSLPPITLLSWEEEVLFVLAHEMHHIEAGWRNYKTWMGMAAERLAELFAIKMLKLWRKTHGT